MVGGQLGRPNCLPQTLTFRDLKASSHPLPLNTHVLFSRTEAQSPIRYSVVGNGFQFPSEPAEVFTPSPVSDLAGARQRATVLDPMIPLSFIIIVIAPPAAPVVFPIRGLHTR